MNAYEDKSKRRVCGRGLGWDMERAEHRKCTRPPGHDGYPHACTDQLLPWGGGEAHGTQDQGQGQRQEVLIDKDVRVQLTDERPPRTSAPIETFDPRGLHPGESYRVLHPLPKDPRLDELSPSPPDAPRQITDARDLLIEDLRGTIATLQRSLSASIRNEEQQREVAAAARDQLDAVNRILKRRNALLDRQHHELRAIRGLVDRMIQEGNTEL